MASRTKQKEEARARRLADEQAKVEQTRRNRRLQMLGGVVIAAIVVVVVAVIVSSGGGKKPFNPVGHRNSKASGAIAKGVESLLAGIPQNGNALGNPHAKVTVTEYGDLECSICDEFALSTSQHASNGSSGTGIEDALIKNDVRSGRIKLVFRSLETASGSNPDPKAFLNQQTAALAAGLQGKEWNFIELFYAQQQPEGTGYVTPAFLNTIASQIPGLNTSAWSSHLQDATLQSTVKADVQQAVAKGYSATPTIVVTGPKGEANPIQSLPSSYAQVEQEIQQVS
jgi:protein-disulfide isomerase